MINVLSLLPDVEKEASGETAHKLGDGGANWGDLRRELTQNREGSLLLRENSWRYLS